jgi:hypothetical protein
MFEEVRPLGSERLYTTGTCPKAIRGVSRVCPEGNPR